MKTLKGEQKYLDIFFLVVLKLFHKSPPIVTPFLVHVTSGTGFPEAMLQVMEIPLPALHFLFTVTLFGSTVIVLVKIVLLSEYINMSDCYFFIYLVVEQELMLWSTQSLQ